MATFNTITHINQARPAPAELPDNALVLVEIQNDVFQVKASELGGGGDAVTWGNLPGKPAVIAAGADEAAAREAIGAGTSNLTLGSGANQAAAGNHSHAFSTLSGTVDDASGSNLQAILADLAARIAAIEAAAGD